MSRIICEYCGTTFPESAGRCPICGNVPERIERIPEDGELSEERGAPAPRRPRQESGHGAAAAQGQRRREPREPERRKREQPQSQETSRRDPEQLRREREEREARRARREEEQRRAAQRTRAERRPEPDEEETDEDGIPARRRKKEKRDAPAWLPWLLLAAVLLLAIFAVFRFIWGARHTQPAATEPSTESTAASTDAARPCQGLVLKRSEIQLAKAGQAWLLDVVITPEDTTDRLVFTSADPAVATVSEKGKVEAVGPGETVITVTCGAYKAECKVKCTFEAETKPTETESTEPTEPSGTEATEPSGTESEEYALNYTDITIRSKEEKVRLGIRGLSNVQITWSTDNAAVATVDNGVISVVGSGTTKIHGVYQGKDYACIVRVYLPDETQPTEPGTEPTEATDPEPTGTLTISHQDVTISMNETFRLTLKDANGAVVAASWSVGNSAVCTVSGDGTVTGRGSGTTTVSAVVNGQTYSCIVRVR